MEHACEISLEIFKDDKAFIRVDFTILAAYQAVFER